MINTQTDALKEFEAFEALSAKEMKKALTTGLRKASAKVRTAVRNELKGSVKNSNKRNPKFDDTLQEGVRTTKVKENNGVIYNHITIASNNKKGSGSFRLHILENGNFLNERKNKYWKGKKLKKERSTGNLRAYKFYQKGMATSADDYQRTLNDAINNAVIKINDRKK